MPAYSTPRKRRCDWYLCTKPATDDVFDGWNGSLGPYCAKHARETIAHLNTPGTPGPLTINARGDIAPERKEP